MKILLVISSLLFICLTSFSKPSDSFLPISGEYSVASCQKKLNGDYLLYLQDWCSSNKLTISVGPTGYGAIGLIVRPGNLAHYGFHIDGYGAISQTNEGVLWSYEDLGSKFNSRSVFNFSQVASSTYKLKISSQREKLQDCDGCSSYVEEFEFTLQK